MFSVTTLNFPAHEIVGTLDWSTAWSAEGGPTLATGSVAVPDDEPISLSIFRVTGAERASDDGWVIHSGPDPVNLTFLLDLPSDRIDSVTLRAPLIEGSMTYLPHLSPGLRRLVASNADLTDVSLTHIGQLTELTYLQTFGNAFTDEGVQQLVALQQLTHLYLEEESLTVTALAFVSSLPLLERLGLQDMPVTDEDLERLRAELPGVRVDR
jgi:hypothetical protein